MKTISKFLIILLLLSIQKTYSQSPSKPRIIITADPELDDNNSLIRFILYATDVKIEGLIYTSSQFHWKGDGKGTKWFVPGREYNRFGLNLCPCESWRWAKDERFIHDIVDAYEQVYPNLKIHHKEYPSPTDLKSKIRYGNIEFDGDISKDSPGSDLIKQLMLDDQPGQLFITAWGGHSTIARALKSIQDQYEYTTQWDQIKNKISRKVVLLASGDQDDTYAKYIKPNWPLIESRQFKGGPNYSYGAQINAKPENAPLLSSKWMKENVSDRGPLGKLYRVWGDGKQMVKDDKMDFFGFDGFTADQLKQKGYVVWMPLQPKGSWLGEGDTFTFMNMLNNGLRAYEKDAIAGWSGMNIMNSDNELFSFSSSDTSAAGLSNSIGSMNRNSSATLPDFFPAAQNDFAARMKWSVTKNYKDANHEPIITIEGPLHVMAKSGEKIRINAKATDPDGNKITYHWYSLNPNHTGLTINNAHTNQVEIILAANAVKNQSVEIICEVKDDGTPALTRYQKLLVTIR